MKTLKMLALAVLMTMTSGIAAHAAEDPIYTGTFSSTAVSGYDTVAYFTEGKPVKGSSDHKSKWRGATWLFSSAENKAKFDANQEQYAPQYGGYCAWAMAGGNFAPGDPKVWIVLNDKLYLNYDESIRKKWDADRAGFIVKADQQYPALADLK